MALPTIVPTGFSGTYTDFLLVKQSREGVVKRVQGSVSIPSATAAATLVGLFPITAGMSFAGLSDKSFYVADLDTGATVTMSIGVAYQNSTEGTDNLVLVTAVSTIAQTGGYFTLGTPGTNDWPTFVSTGNGWIVANVTAGPTTTTGSVTFNVSSVYDQPVLIA